MYAIDAATPLCYCARVSFPRVSQGIDVSQMIQSEAVVSRGWVVRSCERVIRLIVVIVDDSFVVVRYRSFIVNGKPLDERIFVRRVAACSRYRVKYR